MNETTRWSNCVYTHRPIINQLYGNEKQNCRKCTICLGNLAYKIWFETFNLDGWIEESEYKTSTFGKDRVNKEIKERTKRVKELQNKAKNIRRI